MSDTANQPRLRLLKVVVQPTYVLDDGETLTEQQTQGAIAIPAKDWPSWAARDPLTWIGPQQAAEGAAEDQE